MLKQSLTLQIMNWTDHYQKERTRKVIGVMKDELAGKSMIEFLGLRAKTHSYSIDDSSQDKKPKGTKNYVIKRKLEFEDYKNRLIATQLENEINHLETEKKWNWDSLKKDHKEFIKNIILILKTQQRFKSKRHNVFIEEINMIEWW